jgi:hypothetical protein
MKGPSRQANHRLKSSALRICYNLVLGVLFAGCVSAPRIIPIAVFPGSLKPSASQITDYPDAMAAILWVMTEELKLPSIDATLILYPNQWEFESGLVSELRMEPVLAAQTVSFAWGVGSHRKVLANDLHLSRQMWPERIRFLAHEFTHTVQYALANGRRGASDQWLREGFADWVSYKVLETLGLDTLANRRKIRIDQAWRAKHSQSFPSLTQLVTFRDWVTWRNTLGLEATYAQAFLAVDFLIERKGYSAVIEYFRLFAHSNDRLINFMTVFDERVSSFDKEFSSYLQKLLK